MNEEFTFPMLKRAMRRRHIARLKKLREHYWGGFAKNSPRSLGRIVQTPHVCSCHLCGNPRKIFGGTIQERRLESVESLIPLACKH